MKFVGEDGEFDVDAYRYAAKLTITAQEILVDNASYPTPRIEENSHRFRPLGLGYANLGALLMSRGLAYDSQEGRDYAAALTAIMHGEAYRQSAVIARDHGGPFSEYRKNEQPFLRVIAKHRDAAYAIPKDGVPADLLEASRLVYDEALELGREHGYRNAQVTVLAPTGTIAFMMDCDTTGIEPDIALIKYKKLVGEGFLKIVNQTVPAALQEARLRAPSRSRRSSPTSTSARRSRARRTSSREHLSVFDCAFKPVNGERSIHYMGHVRMMARGPAVPVGRDQQDRQHARGRHGRGDRGGLPRGLEARPQGHRHLPRRRPSGASRSARARRRTPTRGPTPGSSPSYGHSSRPPRRRRRSRTATASRPSGRRSPTSSMSPATRATSPSGCTPTASPARSSSRWPRRARPCRA